MVTNVKPCQFNTTHKGFPNSNECFTQHGWVLAYILILILYSTLSFGVLIQLMIEALNFGGDHQPDKPWLLTQRRFYWPSLGQLYYELCNNSSNSFRICICIPSLHIIQCIAVSFGLGDDWTFLFLLIILEKIYGFVDYKNTSSLC